MLCKTVSTKTRAAMLDLLKTAPRAGAELHRVGGIDFTRPFSAARLTGRFTARTALQAVNMDGTRGAVYVLLKKPSVWNSKYHVVKLDPLTRCFSIDVHPDYNSGLDHFSFKTDLDPARKSNGVAYVIAQPVELLKPAAIYSPDLDARFRWTPGQFNPRFTSDGHGRTCVGSVALIDTATDGRTFEYHPGDAYFWKVQFDLFPAMDTVIDKSGYLLPERHQELKRAARTLKESRKKAAYTATNNAGTLSELRALVQQATADAVQRLQAGAAAGNVTETGRAIYLHLATAIKDLAALESADAKKDLASQAMFETRANWVKNAVTAYYARVKGAGIHD